MPTYSYKATDPEGKVVSGTMEVTKERDVVAGLHEIGYIPMRISLSEGGRKNLGLDVSAGFLSIFKSVSTKDVVMFTQDLASLLEAGLPVDRSLSILIDATEKDKFKTVIRDILKTVQGGGYLSDGLAKHPGIFSTLYVNMVRAGEAGGVLEAVLARLGVFLENSQDLKDFVRSAMVYPLFLVFVAGISIIILMTFVIPKFSVIFADMGQTIPLTTRFLLMSSEILRSWWPVILAGLGMAGFLSRRYLKTPAGRLRLDQYKLRLPFARELVKKMEVARFARTLGTLTRSGVPILQALNLVKEVIVNRIIARSMGTVYDRVKEGERLSGPLGETGIFPSLAIQMITVGEETGRLDDMLLRVAENYEKAVRNTVKRLISLLEPVMILALGLVVGFIVISMLTAIFSMNEMPF